MVPQRVCKDEGAVVMELRAVEYQRVRSYGRAEKKAHRAREQLGLRGYSHCE